jgi:hypothetical protein
MVDLQQQLADDLARNEAELRDLEAKEREIEERRQAIVHVNDYIKALLKSAVAPMKEELIVTSAGFLPIPEAAKVILQDAGTPLPVHEILKRGIDRKLIDGNNPNIGPSVRAMFTKDRQRGLNRWVKVGRGIYGLAGRDDALAMPQGQEEEEEVAV